MPCGLGGASLRPWRGRCLSAGLRWAGRWSTQGQKPNDRTEGCPGGHNLATSCWAATTTLTQPARHPGTCAARPHGLLSFHGEVNLVGRRHVGSAAHPTCPAGRSGNTCCPKIPRLWVVNTRRQPCHRLLGWFLPVGRCSARCLPTVGSQLKDARHPKQGGGVDVVTTGMHDAGVGGRVVLVGLRDGRASMSARKATVRESGCWP